MTPIKVIDSTQLPIFPPVSTGILLWLFLDRLHAPQLVWGIVGTIFGIIFIVRCVVFWMQKQIKIKELLLLPILLCIAVGLNAQPTASTISQQEQNKLDSIDRCIDFGNAALAIQMGLMEWDTVITTDNYTSCFSYHYHNPVKVVYNLYQGGGNCSRATYRFKNDIPGLPTARQKDYAGSSYDEGHLADAADFAYDCKLDEETFRFYNCVPQTAALNRGPWKHWETQIRKESQSDSLHIEAGSIFYPHQFIGDSVYVPLYCYKIVTSLTTHQTLHYIICNNAFYGVECKDMMLEEGK